MSMMRMMTKMCLHVIDPDLLILQLLDDPLWQIASHLVVQELLGLLDVFHPVVLGQVEVVFPVDVHTLQIEAALCRQKADGAGLRDLLPVHSAADPVQHADVLSEAGPDKLALFVQAEPVDVEDLGHVAARLVEVQPVLQVIAKVVAHEWPHGHWVVHDLLAWKIKPNDQYQGMLQYAWGPIRRDNYL